MASQFNPDQLRQANEQLQRIIQVAQANGWDLTYDQAWKQAVTDVAGSNNMDPTAAVAANPANAPTNQPYAPGAYDLSTPQGGIMGQLGMNQFLAGLQSMYNRVNEQGPYGSATYTQNPDGSFTRNYQLSENQALLNAQQEAHDIQTGTAANKMLQNVLANYEHNPFSLSQLGAQAPVFDPTGLNQNLARGFEDIPALLGEGDLLGERQRIEDKLYNRYSERMAPRFQKEKEEMAQKLANQGLTPGSPAFEQQMAALDQRQNDALLDASSRATEFGGGEMQRSFGMSRDTRRQGIEEALSQYGMDVGDWERRMNLAQTEFQTGGQERDRALQESLLERDRPFQEMMSLLGSRRGVMNPQYQGISQIGIPGIDVAGTALGYGGLDLQRQGLLQEGQLAREQMDLQRFMHQNPQFAPQQDLFGLQNLRHQHAMELEQLRQQGQGGGGGGKGGLGAAAGGLAGAVGSGIGSGIGGAIGSGIGGLFGMPAQTGATYKPAVMPSQYDAGRYNIAY